MHRSRFTIPICAFVHGALLMAILVLYLMSTYENDLYDQLVLQITQNGMTEQEIALSLLHGTHSLLKPRKQMINPYSDTSVRERLFGSSDIHLMYPRGNCGSYSHVLARLLQRAGIEARLGQMKCGDVWGCHIMVEAKVDGRFVSLDALYDLAFIRLDGKLASFKELNENWQYYKLQTPDDYSDWYAYEDIRYTNWQKVPFFMPLIKNIAHFFLGDKVNGVSIRSWVLNVYKTYIYLLLFVYLLLFIFTVYLLRKNKH